MKKTILVALSICCFSAFNTSCGNSATEETVTTTDTGAADTSGKVPGTSAILADGSCAGCTDATPCGDDCLSNILECHRIEPNVFRARTRDAGFSGAGHSPHDVATICSMATSANCGTQFIWVDGDHDSTHLDSDIIFEVRNKLGSTPVTYEIALFRAICAKKPMEIKFYKGKRENLTDDDILIRVKYSATETVHYDLSDSPDYSANSTQSNNK